MRFALDEKPIQDGQTIHLIGAPETDQTEVTLNSDPWIGLGSFAEAKQSAQAEVTRYRWALLLGGVGSVLLVGLGTLL
ncbi:hypothetical protein PM025_17240 [Halorubrum ezzemoulense]|uniref:hypothetical protein n=1 Tax=Halorubrum ezzemoulense TaxID=337243 RepID=UPI00232FFEDF|nr:hypothetical protein [Halorubrum ezzemoulense]MDB2265824.1 hypothetical protein [Halorubrum ezzemoulense]